MIVIPDNYDQFVAHDAEMYEAERKRKKCECCGNPIWEDYAYMPGGVLYCEKCINDSMVYIGDDDEEIPDC